VFVIDADDATRITHETILRNEGYELMSAPDGARALSLLREQAPDLVLLGDKIGTMPVVRLIQVLRGDPMLNETRIVLYAAGSDGARHDAAMQAGANAYIRLPVTPHELVREVVGLIGRV
jgi:CheY-like chemotaxis protein